jgi:phosphatidate cytidylyltransferase
MAQDPGQLDLRRPKFRLRVISAVIGIGLAFGLIWYSPWSVTAFIFVLAIFASHELFWLFEEKGYHPARILGAGSCLGFILLTSFTGTRYHPLALMAVFVASCLFLVLRSTPWFPYWDPFARLSKGERPEFRMGTISDVATTFLGVVLTGWLPSYIPLLRQLEYPNPADRLSHPPLGTAITFLYFGSIFATDVGAYLIGKTWGRHELIGPLSPKKTVEGSLGGIALAIVYAGLVGWAFHLSPWHCVGLGLVISLVAQLSDLTESMIKRDAGKKDSGDIIPGHGGVLDRVDSFLLSGAVTYYYLLYVWQVIGERQ